MIWITSLHRETKGGASSTSSCKRTIGRIHSRLSQGRSITPTFFHVGFTRSARARQTEEKSCQAPRYILCPRCRGIIAADQSIRSLSHCCAYGPRSSGSDPLQSIPILAQHSLSCWARQFNPPGPAMPASVVEELCSQAWRVGLLAFDHIIADRACEGFRHFFPNGNIFPEERDSRTRSTFNKQTQFVVEAQKRFILSWTSKFVREDDTGLLRRTLHAIPLLLRNKGCDVFIVDGSPRTRRKTERRGAKEGKLREGVKRSSSRLGSRGRARCRTRRGAEQ